MKLIERPWNVVTGKGNLENLHVLKHFPVFFGCVDTDPDEDLFADMHWCIDPETGVIQLSKLIPLEILYQMQHVDGCGPTWGKYYEEFSAFISSHNPGHVLEIGGGQGKIAEIVTSQKNNTFWTIVEPNPAHRGSDRIEILRSFFDEKFEYEGTIDTVVFSQVLEHAYDPRSFVSTIARFLPANGKLIFAYPNLELWLRKKYTNALNFEHTMFLTDHHVDYLLQKNGFYISDKRVYGEHSFFYLVEKKEQKLETSQPPNKYREYKAIFNEFVDYHTKVVEDLNKRIIDNNVPIYLFGAHIFSQYLLCFGLNQNRIISILDNSKTKQGKRLYGTHFRVESPSVLRGLKKATVILKAGIYNEEIKKDILNNINRNVMFWE